MLDRNGLREAIGVPLIDKDKFALHAEARLFDCPNVTDLSPRYGYGYRYTDKMAEKLLRMPLPAGDHLLSDLGMEFYGQAIRRRRSVLDLDPEVRLSGISGWYMQGLEPTCVPWSAVNLAAAHKAEINPKFVAELLNEANDRGFSSREPGLTADAIEASLRKHKDVNLRYLGDSSGSSDLQSYAEMARLLLSAGTFYLDSVGEGYYNDDDPSLHQIAVVGYEVDQRGVMDLEIVDSNMGVLKVPVEFLKQVRTGEMSLFRKKRAQTNKSVSAIPTELVS